MTYHSLFTPPESVIEGCLEELSYFLNSLFPLGRTALIDYGSFINFISTTFNSIGSIVLHAMALIKRLFIRLDRDFRITHLNMCLHRLFLTSLILSTKLLQDDPLKHCNIINEHLPFLSMKRLNKMEQDFLSMIDYNINIDRNELLSFCKENLPFCLKNRFITHYFIQTTPFASRLQTPLPPQLAPLALLAPPSPPDSDEDEGEQRLSGSEKKSLLPFL